MEQISLIGNIGKDAEIKEGNGKETIFFTVATNYTFKDANGEKVQKTNWWTVFTNSKQIVPFLKKGTQVFIQGRPNFSIYVAQDGTKSVSLDINATMIQLVGGKKEETK